MRAGSGVIDRIGERDGLACLGRDGLKRLVFALVVERECELLVCLGVGRAFGNFAHLEGCARRGGVGVIEYGVFGLLVVVCNGDGDLVVAIALTDGDLCLYICSTGPMGLVQLAFFVDGVGVGLTDVRVVDVGGCERGDAALIGRCVLEGRSGGGVFARGGCRERKALVVFERSAIDRLFGLERKAAARSGVGVHEERELAVAERRV